MAVGIVAVFNGSYHSPGFDITISGLSGYDTITVERIDTTGENADTPVRGADQAAISGSAFAVTDYEAPVGKTIVYRVTATSKAATDTFTRTVSSGWGVSSFGEAWTPGDATVLSVNGGQGVIAIPANNITYRNVIGNSTLKDVDVTVKITNPVTVTGAIVAAGVVVRYVDASNHYLATARFNPTGDVDIIMQRVVGGVFTTIGPVGATSGTHTAGEAWKLRVLVVGDQISARAWQDFDPEPSTWATTATVTGIAAGRVGVRARVETGNTNTLPLNLTFDDFTVRGVGSNPVLTSVATSSSVGIQDQFAREVSSGWGSPDIGPAWAIRSGAIPDFFVASGVGRMSMTQRSVSGSLGTEYVMGSPLSHTNIDQTVKFRPVATPAGDTLRFALVARETDRNNWWEFETGFLTNGSMQVRIGREVNGASIYENPVTVPTTYTAGSWYWMRFQVVGSTLRGRVWKDGTTEQSSWDMQITSTLLASGNFVGVKAFSSAFSSNPTPEVVEFDSYSLTILDNTTVIEADDAGTTWLKSVGQPALSRRVNMVEFDEHGRPGRILGEYEVLGRQNKVVLTDTLGGREGSLTLVTYQMNGVWESDSYWRDIQSLISKGGTLLLQTAGTTFTAEDDMYLEVKNLSRKRVGLVGGELVHLHTIDFIEVDRPASAQEALSLRNWQSVLDQNSTWQNVLTNHTSWLDVLQRDL